jgi:DNA-binding IclR family transcriptional regulator
MSTLSGLVDEKTLRILEMFFRNPKEFYHLSKVSLDSDVPLATTFRIVNHLADAGILDITTVSKLKLYRLADSGKVRKLRRAL